MFAADLPLAEELLFLSYIHLLQSACAAVLPRLIPGRAEGLASKKMAEPSDQSVSDGVQTHSPLCVKIYLLLQS